MSHGSHVDAPADLAALIAWVDSDLDLLDEVSAEFVVQAPEWIDGLRSAVGAGDAPNTFRVAHTIKGAVSNFGAPAIFAAAAELEALGRAGSLDGAAALLPRVVGGVEQLAAFLAARPWRA